MAMILFCMEKIKGILIKGARHIEAVTGIESGDWVGTLCVADSLPG